MRPDERVRNDLSCLMMSAVNELSNQHAGNTRGAKSTVLPLSTWRKIHSEIPNVKDVKLTNPPKPKPGCQSEDRGRIQFDANQKSRQQKKAQGGC